MSANAISILNVAGVSLSGRDFSWVQIAGANLNHALCGNTNFKGANLARVSFYDAWLYKAQMGGANLENANFGFPQYHTPSELLRVFQIRFQVEFGRWFLYVGIAVNEQTSKVVKWDLLLGNIALEFESIDEGRADGFLNTYDFAITDNYLSICSEKLSLFNLETGSPIASCPIPYLEISDENMFENGHHRCYTSHNILIIERSVHVQGYAFSIAIPADGATDHTNILLTLTMDLRFTTPYLQSGFDFGSNYLCVNFMNYVDIFELGLLSDGSNPNPKYHLEVGAGEWTNGAGSFDVDPMKGHIAIGRYMGVLEIKTLDDSALIKSLSFPCHSIEILRYSGKFKYLGAGCLDPTRGNSIRVWETSTWELLITVNLVKQTPVALEFWITTEKVVVGIALGDSGVGIKLFTVDQKKDKALEIMGKDKVLTTRKYLQESISGICVSGDGSSFATTLAKSQEGLGALVPNIIGTNVRKYFVQLWNSSDGRRLGSFMLELSQMDSRLLLMTFVNGNCILLVERCGKPKYGDEYFYFYDFSGRILQGITKIDYSGEHDFTKKEGFQTNHQGTLFSRSLSDGSIDLFHIKNGQPYMVYWKNLKGGPMANLKHMSKARSIRFNSSGSLIVSSCQEYTGYPEEPLSAIIRVWAITSGELKAEFIIDLYFKSPTFLMSINNDVRLILASNTKLVLVVYKESWIKQKVLNESPKVLKKILVKAQSVGGVKFAVDGTANFLALMTEETVLQIWSLGKKIILLAEISLWFEPFFLAFLEITESRFTRLLVAGMRNICAVQVNYDGNWSVIWSQCSYLSLNLKNLQLDQCISLKEFHKRFLVEAGAQGFSACSQQEYISKAVIIQPLLGSSTLHHLSILSDGHSQKYPSESNWILSCVVKKSLTFPPIVREFHQHAFLVVEGVQNKRRFLFEAHLRYDKGENKVFFIIRPISDILELKERLTPSDTFNVRIKQWDLPACDGEDLIRDILTDYQLHLEYKLMNKNCITWCKKKLKNCNIKLGSLPIDFIATPSILLNRPRLK